MTDHSHVRLAVHPASPRRRWFQFRLRTVLIVVAVLTVPLAWKVNQVRRQRAAVAAIRHIDGKASIYYAMGNNTPGGPAWLHGWLSDDFFDHVDGLLCYGAQDDHRILKHAAEFPYLRLLIVSTPTTIKSRITDEDVEMVSQCAELRRLLLRCPNVTGRGLASIGTLAHLEELSLEAAIGDADLSHLTGLKTLRDLSLYDTQVRGPGVAQLAPLKQLESLSLRRSPCTDECLEPLSQLVNLTKLTLDETDISDARLSCLDELVNLRELSLARTRVTDAGLARLTRLTSLQTIGLAYTDVTDEGAAQLQARLPNLKEIYRTNDRYSPVNRDAQPTAP